MIGDTPAAGPATASTTRDDWREALRVAWRSRAPREQLLVQVAGASLALLLLWWVTLQPALRTLQTAPAQLEALDVQLQAMQRLATEARELRGAPPVSGEQALAALNAAIERLGDKAKLTMQGERALVTLDKVSTPLLREWLQDLRSAARARPIEVTLARTPQGFSGTLVLVLPGTPPSGAPR